MMLWSLPAMVFLRVMKMRRAAASMVPSSSGVPPRLRTSALQLGRQLLALQPAAFEQILKAKFFASPAASL